MVPMFLFIMGFCTLVPGSYALHLSKPVLQGPSHAPEKSIIEYFCEVPDKPENLTILYELFTENNKDRPTGEYTSTHSEKANFPLKTKLSYEGPIVCKASGFNNSDIVPAYSNSIDFRIFYPVSEAIISSPEELWEGQDLILVCNITAGTHVSYNWRINNVAVGVPYDRTVNTLTIKNVAVHDAGNYTCEASNRFNETETFTSQSNAKDIVVKEYLSKPEISFSIVKDETITAQVTCQSFKGTPPINFTLYNDSVVLSRETTDSLKHTFSVAISLNQYMGTVHCHVSNEGNEAQSQPLRLEVVSVGGAVTMRREVDMASNFQVVGLKLFCKVDRGTLPQYYWYFNGNRLDERGTFYAVAWPDHSLLLLSVSPESSGVYHCEAGNKFENTSIVRSVKLPISKDELNRVPTKVVVTIFTCFSLLVAAVTACCFYGVIYRRRLSSSEYILDEAATEMDRLHEGDAETDSMTSDECNEVEEEDYLEDEDVVIEAKMDDSDQSYVESVEELISIVQELLKSTEPEKDSTSEP
ncbi:Fc receptor-like protein 3 [Chanos chanos]|uniref:Fc receptor-like protein 3 n=1 Tax=Chanos chanos TaxID=29144 RepID=A0A6J2V8Z0_CHACN|nr:Fc receptor-like protein 3 [Chanos chanos]